MTATPRHYWQTKPSADRLGNAPWRHGPLQPLAESKPLPRTMGEIHAIALEKQKHRWWPFNRKDR